MPSLRTPVAHWLSIRVRIACAAVFVVSLFLPPYVPPSSFAAEEGDPEGGRYFLVEEGFLMKTSSLTEQGARRAYAQGIIHKVENGESVMTIAEFYGLKAETIRWANNLADNATIKPGQELLILPVDGVVHKVKRGENLVRIAELYKIPFDQIRDRNNLGDDYLLTGQELIIPGGKPLPPPAPTVVAATQPKAQPNVPAVTRQLDEKPPSVRRQIYEAPVSVGALGQPCTCSITQYFSARHFALDMQDKGGGPIFAAEAGTVIRADTGWNGGYGNVIEIDHGNGLVTLYGHNKELHVAVGDTVTRGQHIADMGNTGLVYGPTGIHVHFEVRVNGIKKNPLLYLE